MTPPEAPQVTPRVSAINWARRANTGGVGSSAVRVLASSKAPINGTRTTWALIEGRSSTVVARSVSRLSVCCLGRGSNRQRRPRPPLLHRLLGCVGGGVGVHAGGVAVDDNAESGHSLRGEQQLPCGGQHVLAAAMTEAEVGRQFRELPEVGDSGFRWIRVPSGSTSSSAVTTAAAASQRGSLSAAVRRGPVPAAGVETLSGAGGVAGWSLSWSWMSSVGAALAVCSTGASSGWSTSPVRWLSSSAGTGSAVGSSPAGGSASSVVSVASGSSVGGALRLTAMAGWGCRVDRWAGACCRGRRPRRPGCVVA